MPRKKRTIVEETLPDNPAIEDETITDFMCVLTKVHKLSGADRFFCFQSETPVDEVLIQSQYPSGGKFIVTEYNSAGSLLDTKMINIEAKPFAVTGVNGNGGEDIRSRMLLEELAFTRNMMLQMINGMFNSKSQQSATPLAEIAQVMQTIHTMSPAINPTDLVLKGMELGIKANGGAPDWKAQLAETAKEILPTVVQTLGTVRQTQPQQGPMMIQAAPATLIKQGLDWLKPRIISGMDTESAVNWVITNANDPTCQQLLMHAAQGLDAFVKIDPEIANEPYKTWFINAIQALKEWYAAQSANQNDNDGGDGNDTDVANDADISTGQSTIRKIG